VKVSTFPPLPQKLGRQIPSIFCTEYHRDDPKNPESFLTVSRAVSENIRHFTLRAYRLSTKNTTRTESLDTPPHYNLVIMLLV